MTAKIIAVSNQKGGCGKTTICMHVAGTLGRRGMKVLLVDADAQHSAKSWHTTGKGKFPTELIFVASEKERRDGAPEEQLHEMIEPHIENYDVIVIDCPPSVESSRTQSALSISDFVLIPFLPSANDARSFPGIKNLIDLAREQLNPDLTARVVVNMLQKTSLSENVLDVISAKGVPFLKTRLALRTAFRESSALGCTVHDLKDDKAIAEADALVNEVFELVFADTAQTAAAV